MGETNRGWRTWSGTARCTPAHLLRPGRIGDITTAVRFAADRGLTVRAAGTGHSFNALACTDGVLLDLSAFAGVVDCRPDAGTIEVKAGTTIAQANRALAGVGMALANVGTLAAQTVAGALSTGNHGSGLGHRPFADQVVAVRLVTADGAVRTVDAESDPELMRCARTALGALGVIATVTLRCVPRFNLRVAHGSEPFDGFLERVDDWARSGDHVAFNWLPWSTRIATRAMSGTADPVSRRVAGHRFARTLDEIRCGSLGLYGRLAPRAVPGLSDRLRGRRATPDYVDASDEVFSFPQPVRFLALEHALDLADVAPALRALRGLLRRSGHYSPYSVLGRVGAADDSPLSPSYGRTTGYVNLTVPRSAGYLEMLRGCEYLLRDFGARPHWGKAHTATADVLAPRYPQWALFQRIRAGLDPDDRFTNDYLRRVLGPVRDPAVVAAGRAPE
jgi:L-gulono-1,4-lactone dehydrogenase